MAESAKRPAADTRTQSGTPPTAGTRPPDAAAPPHPDPAIARPLWRVVLALALPVLAQQFLNLTINLSDRALAGRFQTAAVDDSDASPAVIDHAKVL